jgi:hypothetical protein
MQFLIEFINLKTQETVTSLHSIIMKAAVKNHYSISHNLTFLYLYFGITSCDLSKCCISSSDSALVTHKQLQKLKWCVTYA